MFHKKSQNTDFTFNSNSKRKMVEASCSTTLGINPHLTTIGSYYDIMLTIYFKSEYKCNHDSVTLMFIL